MTIQSPKYQKPLQVRDESITPASKCPYCQHRFDRASGVTLDTDGPAPQPKPNDMTVCIACGGWCVFTEDLSTRAPTPEELIEMDSETRAILTRISETIRLAHKR